MFLWFIGCALLLVWIAFHDPAVDHRVLMAGAVLPDVIDAPLGGARYAHALLVAAGLLLIVMLVTRGHRHARRRWLFLPIGMLIHLAADDVWERSELLLWPLLGSFPYGPLPSLDQGAGVIVIKELIGAGLMIWFVSRFGLTEPRNRAQFLRTGRLPRDRVG